MKLGQCLHVWLSDDETTLWRHHHALSVGARVLHRLQEAPRDTSCPLNPGSVVKLFVVVGWTVLNPMAWQL
jgi:hypothetical protein